MSQKYSPLRRKMLSTTGAAVLLTACGSALSPSDHRPPPAGMPPPDSNNVPLPDNSHNNPQCYAKAQQTEGPYFVDEKLSRSDIRADTATGRIQAGIPFILNMVLSQIDGANCIPLSHATIDLWHCNAEGVYSDVVDNQGKFNTKGQNFLRGAQQTDANGKAQFISIYPGWYQGRTVHAHFKIRWTDAQHKTHEFTSQLYFDEAISDAVYKNAPYNPRARDTHNTEDGIYRRGGQDLQLKLITHDGGYMADFHMGLSTT